MVLVLVLMVGHSGFALPSAVVAVLEHVIAVGIERPEGALARSTLLARHFDETVVETEIVTDRVLPALFVFSIVGEAIHDELVDAVQSDFFLVGVLDRHCDQCDVLQFPNFHIYFNESMHSIFQQIQFQLYDLGSNSFSIHVENHSFKIQIELLLIIRAIFFFDLILTKSPFFVKTVRF